MYLDEADSEEIYSKIEAFNCQFEVTKTKSFVEYSQIYKVSPDSETPTLVRQTCECTHAYEIKMFEKAAFINKNPEIESKINEIKSLDLSKPL